MNQQLPTTYYSPLLEEKLIEEILAVFEPQEQAQALEQIMRSLDHAILEAILQQLEEELHEEFLHMLEECYHDPALIDWLEERQEGIIPHIQTVARETKIAIKEMLDGSVEVEIDQS